MRLQAGPPSFPCSKVCRETSPHGAAPPLPHPGLEEADRARGVRGGRAALGLQGHAASQRTGWGPPWHQSCCPPVRHHLCVGPSAKWVPVGAGGRGGARSWGLRVGSLLPPARPLLSALSPAAGLLTGSGAGSPARGPSCTRPPPSPAPSRSSAGPRPPHPRPAPGGCPWCRRTGVPGRLLASGSAQAPAGLWPRRAAPGDSGGSGTRGWAQGGASPGLGVSWSCVGLGRVLTLELGVEETLLRSASLKAPSD